MTMKDPDAKVLNMDGPDPTEVSSTDTVINYKITLNKMSV